MPYIEVANQLFDLEVELYKKTPELFLQKIKSILAGEKHTDKYKNTIQLIDDTQREIFKKKIKHNIMVRHLLPGDFLDNL